MKGVKIFWSSGYQVSDQLVQEKVNGLQCSQEHQLHLSERPHLFLLTGQVFAVDLDKLACSASRTESASSIESLAMIMLFINLKINLSTLRF